MDDTNKYSWICVKIPINKYVTSMSLGLSCIYLLCNNQIYDWFNFTWQDFIICNTSIKLSASVLCSGWLTVPSHEIKLLSTERKLMSASPAVNLYINYCAYIQLKHRNVKSVVACLFWVLQGLKRLHSW
jgi:hypothetical protein